MNDFLQITGIKANIKKLFPGLNFNEKEHKYTYYKTNLISTTTFLKKYVPEFEEKSIARAKTYIYNKKRISSTQRTENYYIERWKAINRVSTEKGTRVHVFAENNYPDFIDRPYCGQEAGVIEFFKWLPDNYVVLFMEFRLYNIKYKKAGTLDFVLYNKDTNNIVLADWKTNSKNIFQCYNDQCLLDPFYKLKATEYNKYSLQLSDYQNMLDLANCQYKVEDKWIIHLYDNDWTKLDKYTDPSKFNLDISVQPLSHGDNFRVYSATDFTKELLLEYNYI